ncbi:methyltransferase family protein [Corynebacterium durum]|uniref:methyltransferase family protein n=1 Tax=Corynebacterium durum TaxID=61592 RepID=UPI004025E7BD
MDNFRVPPAVIALGAAIVQLPFGRKAKGTLLSRGAALGLASASTLMGASAVAKFRAEATTVDPMNVSAAATVVQSGPFRLTRNPMYVGTAGMLFAHALWRKSLLAVMPAVIYIAMIDRFQIPAEEAVLKEKFGATYEDYAQRVPRWVLR